MVNKYERQKRRTERARHRAIVTLAAVLLLLVAVSLIVMARIADRDDAVPAETIQKNMDALGFTPAPKEDIEETMHTEPSEDVILLAKIMQEEDGYEWPDAMVMALGEVVLNRVASPAFPNTIRDVLYQKNPTQYEPVWFAGWEDLDPDQRYIDLAERLLTGERVINDPAVVYQALFAQGSETILTYRDTALGTTTYFCREG